MLAPNPPNRLHCQHSPPPASNQSEQRIRPNGRGSILDADNPAQGVKIARRNTDRPKSRRLGPGRLQGRTVAWQSRRDDRLNCARNIAYTVCRPVTFLGGGVRRIMWESTVISFTDRKTCIS